MKPEDATSPLINFLFQESDHVKSDQYLKDSMELMTARIKIGLSSIKWHQKVLGKQKYCWTGTVRHWVWETDTWRVYVSKRGAAFEAGAFLTVDEAWTAWQDYFNKMK